jgi:ABC-2 type transport system ATP-binding protein
MSKSPLIKTQNLSKVFGRRKVVDKINLRVETGDIYRFLGLYGSGKTTTIRMLLGLVFSTEGPVILNGYNIDVF